MIRNFVRLAIGTMVFIFLKSSCVFGLEAYIPHITGGYDDWADYLEADNNRANNVSFTLILVAQDSVVYNGTISVPGLSERVIDLKSLASNAQCGVIIYDDAELSFRLAFNNLNGGGVAEFQLTSELNNILSLYFSDFNPDISWKGITLANLFETTASVDLYAVGGGGILDRSSITIGPGTRIVGTHNVFFPNLSFIDIKKIIAVSETGLCGISISGNADSSLLLFTAGAYLTKFDSANPDPYRRIMIEKMRGTWFFEFTSASTFEALYDLNIYAGESPTTPGQYDMIGYDFNNELVISSYNQSLGIFGLIDGEPDLTRFFIFNFVSKNEVTGCYIEIVNDVFGPCNPMDGTKIRPHLISESPLIPAIKSLKTSDTTELQQSDESELWLVEESQIWDVDFEIDQDVIDEYHRLKDLLNQMSHE